MIYPNLSSLKVIKRHFRNDIKTVRRMVEKFPFHPRTHYPFDCDLLKDFDYFKNNKDYFLRIIQQLQRMSEEDTPLSIRIKELRELSKAYHPTVPEWYIILSVDSYIRQYEPELLEFLTDEIAEVREEAKHEQEKDVSIVRETDEKENETKKS